ncbi:nitroreductase family protein [Nonomuraea sp. NPDC026600]|uniref:nitroreductase family protein n=1 Tax=Nonomuraea sp. NPDC026600 TaxID=3155363 RepID=UPI0033DA2166
MADLWRRGLASPAAPQPHDGPSRHDYTAEAGWHTIADSLHHLVDILDQVPVLLVPCIQVGSRAELDDPATQAGTWGSVLPAVWSFMLAARSRGLGTVWTTPHLNHERQAATLLGLPYETTVQCALIPIAWTIGTQSSPPTASPSPRSRTGITGRSHERKPKSTYKIPWSAARPAILMIPPPSGRAQTSAPRAETEPLRRSTPQ